MLLKNAQNTVDVSKMTAKMASGSSIQIETLEKTWATITNGIEETRRIQEDARKKRQEDQFVWRQSNRILTNNTMCHR